MSKVGLQIFNVFDLKNLTKRQEYGLKYSNNTIILESRGQGQIYPNKGDWICVDGDKDLYIIQDIKIYKTKFANEIHLKIEEFNKYCKL